jgi:hypothetical protein
MSAGRIGVWIVVIWVGFTLLGALLHAVKWLIYAAILATIIVVLVGALNRRSSPPPKA